jgi:hypothetical protein
MWMHLGMLEKIGDEKSKIKDPVIEKFVKIGIKAIVKWVSNNAKHFWSIQENIQPKLDVKIKISA